ncbi:hypothetical protein QBC39DRAFT_115161 [Podospora conica]|nr:hypothetical protein QBC39DRAFT_115161 [Schizothecium conicum]
MAPQLLLCQRLPGFRPANRLSAGLRAVRNSNPGIRKPFHYQHHGGARFHSNTIVWREYFNRCLERRLLTDCPSPDCRTRDLKDLPPSYLIQPGVPLCLVSILRQERERRLPPLSPDCQADDDAPLPLPIRASVPVCLFILLLFYYLVDSRFGPVTTREISKLECGPANPFGTLVPKCLVANNETSYLGDENAGEARVAAGTLLFPLSSTC